MLFYSNIPGEGQNITKREVHLQKQRSSFKYRQMASTTNYPYKKRKRKKLRKSPFIRSSQIPLIRKFPLKLKETNNQTLSKRQSFISNPTSDVRFTLLFVIPPIMGILSLIGLAFTLAYSYQFSSPEFNLSPIVTYTEGSYDISDEDEDPSTNTGTATGGATSDNTNPANTNENLNIDVTPPLVAATGAARIM